ncbi:MAG: hypothetical protein GY697_14880 [Desulfobacterales bacterium]|nr:hypothetical protein [Desulfobacterales bacterium]
MTEQLIAPVAGPKHPVPKPAHPGIKKAQEISPLEDSSPKAQRLRKACQDMESLFIHQLLKEMRATIPKSGLFGKSHAQDIYTGMLDGRLAQEISQNRGLGLSTLLMRQLGVVEGPFDEDSR